MSWLKRQAQFCLAMACSLGLGRIIFYYLIYEPISIRGPVYAAAPYESLRSHLSAVKAVRYVSDEPLDEDPAAPRRHEIADIAYARAQYALAPTLLSRSAGVGPLVVANFGSAEALDRFIASGKYLVVARPLPTAALIRPK